MGGSYSYTCSALPDCYWFLCKYKKLLKRLNAYYPMPEMLCISHLIHQISNLFPSAIAAYSIKIAFSVYIFSLQFISLPYSFYINLQYTCVSHRPGGNQCWESVLQTRLEEVQLGQTWKPPHSKDYVHGIWKFYISCWGRKQLIIWSSCKVYEPQ